MKAAIMTFVRAYNYGAVLQSYALNKVINDNGVLCETIDYNPEYFYNLYNYTYMDKRRIVPFRPIKKWKGLLSVTKSIKVRNRSFEKFISKNIRLSEKQYKDNEELRELSNKYDVFFTGSDQVWNDKCAKFDPAFFLDFIDCEEKKFSYAASFGFDKIPSELKDTYFQRLNGYNRYSVREDDGVKIIEDLLNKQATKCCDPTLLLDKNEWNKLTNDKLFNTDYILVYYANCSDELMDYAYKLSKEKNMKVICFTSPLNHNDLLKDRYEKYGFINMSISGPQEFVTLFKKAKYVVTSSFHGTVFSIIFEKKFVTVPKLGNGKKNNRSTDLLNSLQLSDRIGHDFNDNVVDNEIDWKSVGEKLEKIRENSLDYIKEIIC